MTDYCGLVSWQDTFQKYLGVFQSWWRLDPQCKLEYNLLTLIFLKHKTLSFFLSFLLSLVKSFTDSLQKTRDFNGLNTTV